jgi:hypothetical protein
MRSAGAKRLRRFSCLSARRPYRAALAGSVRNCCRPGVPRGQRDGPGSPCPCPGPDGDVPRVAPCVLQGAVPGAGASAIRPCRQQRAAPVPDCPPETAAAHATDDPCRAARWPPVAPCADAGRSRPARDDAHPAPLSQGYPAGASAGGMHRDGRDRAPPCLCRDAHARTQSAASQVLASAEGSRLHRVSDLWGEQRPARAPRGAGHAWDPGGQAHRYRTGRGEAAPEGCSRSGSGAREYGPVAPSAAHRGERPFPRAVASDQTRPESAESAQRARAGAERPAARAEGRGVGGDRARRP